MNEPILPGRYESGLMTSDRDFVRAGTVAAGWFALLVAVAMALALLIAFIALDNWLAPPDAPLTGPVHEVSLRDGKGGA